MTRNRLMLAVIGAVVAGCSGTHPSDSDVSSGTVVVSRVAGATRITNETPAPVGQVVWNPEWLALFGACARPTSDCVTLQPGASVVVPDRDIAGYAPSIRRAVVYWWHVEPDGAGGYKANIREVAVQLE